MPLSRPFKASERPGSCIRPAHPSPGTSSSAVAGSPSPHAEAIRRKQVVNQLLATSIVGDPDVDMSCDLHSTSGRWMKMASCLHEMAAEHPPNAAPNHPHPAHVEVRHLEICLKRRAASLPRLTSAARRFEADLQEPALPSRPKARGLGRISRLALASWVTKCTTACGVSCVDLQSDSTHVLLDCRLVEQ